VIPPKVTVICSIFIPKGGLTRKRNTVRWFEALAAHSGVGFNLWLINDASEEPVSDILPHMGPQGYCREVRFFDSDVREGKAKKLNHLLRIVSTRFVAVVDNDAWFPVNWLHDGVARAAIPKSGVCTVLCESTLEHGPLVTDGKLHMYEPPFVGGACLIWDRVKFGPQGFFSERWGIYGQEDSEFVARSQMTVGPLIALLKRGGMFSEAADENGYSAWKRKTLADTAFDCKTYVNSMAKKLGLLETKEVPSPPTFAHQISEKETSKCSLPIKRRKP